MFPEAKINGKDAALWCRERKHSPGYYPISAKDVKGLDKTALMPVEPPPKVVLRAWEKLNMDKRTFNKVQFMAMQECGKYLSMKLNTPRILLVKGMDTLGTVERAIKWSEAVIESQSKEVETSHKLIAVQMVAMCAKSFKDLSEHMMDLADKAREKSDVEKPKNLPPTVALQMNFQGGHPPQVTSSVNTPSANSGDVSESQSETDAP
jgi:hypothetical protein